jgi:hypothetical protein
VIAWAVGAAVVLLAALALALTMRAVTDTQARDAARRDRDELRRRGGFVAAMDDRESVRLVDGEYVVPLSVVVDKHLGRGGAS